MQSGPMDWATILCIFLGKLKENINIIFFP